MIKKMKTPTQQDLNNPKLSKIPARIYIERYGSYNKFLESIGETPNKIRSRKESK
jgi:hypothetical protein